MPTTVVKIQVHKVGDFDFKDKELKLKIQVARGVRQMIEDIHRVSRPVTPMLTGELRGDVIKHVESPSANLTRGSIEWHRFYAWYQERGYTSGPVKRYTTPGTHAHFAEESVKEVTATPSKYFGKEI